ncbi:ABC transporter ATP-binding protein [Marinobacterium aestuariivivens]|uniref:ABC transporter ATP-binding protein n=1 Tax=Marinobacterium aestuariivivens TaxID=1698799 RepID=A0ABW1ZYJ5_9GAMM
MLVGTSGCGKSTTLKMINRLIPLSRGEIRIDGENIERCDEQTLRRRIGYAIQHIGLFPHWTVARNIALVPRLLKWDEARIRDRVEELLTLFGLEPARFADQHPHQLSGGQAQRVGVARALAANPNILLMDEPFGALDPITRENLQAELLRIQSQIHKTIIFVTHDIDEALKLATRIAVMDKGRLIQYDTPERILLNPASDFVERLIGSDERGLRAAACTRVSERLEPLLGELETPEGYALHPGDSLKLALSRMLWLKSERLPVLDDEGRMLGQVSLRQLIARGR